MARFFAGSGITSRVRGAAVFAASARHLWLSKRFRSNRRMITVLSHALRSSVRNAVLYGWSQVRQIEEESRQTGRRSTAAYCTIQTPLPVRQAVRR